MLARVSSRELTEWAAFEQIEGPIGDARLDHLFAMLQALIANANRDKGKTAYTPEQFMPKWGVARQAERGEMDPQSILRAVKKANKALGGEVVGRADVDPG